MWSEIVLYHWSRHQPKPWRVMQTWLFEPEGNSHPPNTSSRQPKHSSSDCLYMGWDKSFCHQWKKIFYVVAVFGRRQRSFRQRSRLCPKWSVLRHSKMQSDEDRVLQFAGQKNDECSVLQQSIECFCWFQTDLLVDESVHRPFQYFDSHIFGVNLKHWTSSLKRH